MCTKSRKLLRLSDFLSSPSADTIGGRNTVVLAKPGLLHCGKTGMGHERAYEIWGHVSGIQQ